MIISVLNQKGGTGKTTIACNLAVSFKAAGYNVALVDADKQGTTATFREQRKEMQLPQIPMFQILTDTLEKDVPALRFDVIIIDVGAKDTKPFRGAMFVSDVIIVPCKPSNADIWSTDTTFSLLTDARRINTKLKIFGLFNMVDPTVKATGDIPTLVKQLEEDYQIRFFKTRIHNRIQYNYTLGNGLGIIEQISDSKAIKEFNAFFKEVQGAETSKA